jgi:hypothetical protein
MTNPCECHKKYGDIRPSAQSVRPGKTTIRQFGQIELEMLASPSKPDPTEEAITSLLFFTDYTWKTVVINQHHNFDNCSGSAKRPPQATEEPGRRHGRHGRRR